MKLPYPIATYPLCGACEQETSHDGDSFVCEPCGLDYGEGSESDRAKFLDPGTSECGAISISAADWGRLGITESPCSLPNGHRSSHWHGLA